MAFNPDELLGKIAFIAIRHSIADDIDFIDLRTASEIEAQAYLRAADIDKRAPGYYMGQPVVGVAMLEVKGVYYDDRSE